MISSVQLITLQESRLQAQRERLRVLSWEQEQELWSQQEREPFLNELPES